MKPYLSRLAGVIRSLVVVCVLGQAPAVFASSRCDVAAPESASPVYVLFFFDRTFDADDETRKWLRQSIETALAIPDVTIQVGGFAEASGREGVRLNEPRRLLPPLNAAQASGMRRSTFGIIQRCREAVRTSVRAELTESMRTILGAGAASAKRSDIGGSLATVSAALRMGTATRRILVIGSDGWEHNDEQDHYRAGKPRLIDVPTELEVFASRELPGNLDSIEVVWAGLGVAASSPASRDLRRLQRYWTEVVIRLGGRVSALDATPVVSLHQILGTRVALSTPAIAAAQAKEAP